jgi:hypothetical protein
MHPVLRTSKEKQNVSRIAVDKEILISWKHLTV